VILVRVFVFELYVSIIQMTTTNSEKTKNLELIINHKSLESALGEIIKLVKNKSLETNVDNLDMTDDENIRLHMVHIRLRTTCDTLMEGFGMSYTDDNSEVPTKQSNIAFDKVKIIKKIYKTLVSNVDMLIGQEIDEKFVSDINLFMIKNELGKTVTIIPGMDIGLVINSFTSEELTVLWSYMYIVYIATIKIIASTNKNKNDGKEWNCMLVLQKRVARMGLTVGKNNKLFNPYVGLISDGTDIDVKNLFNNIEGIKEPSEADLLSNIGLESMLDMEKLNEQLKNIDDDELSNITNTITSMIGGSANSGDNDVTDTCGLLIKHIVDDLKKNGMKNMMNTAMNVSAQMNNTGALDPTKMSKTAEQLSKFMNNSNEKIQNMTDASGNPIGPAVMNSLPMQLLKSMSMNK